jgi:hypothetical protein
MSFTCISLYKSNGLEEFCMIAMFRLLQPSCGSKSFSNVQLSILDPESLLLVNLLHAVHARYNIVQDSPSCAGQD